MEGRRRASQSFHCCQEISLVRRRPDRSSTSHQSALNRGLWSPWCLWESCTRWLLHPGRWLGKSQEAQCCRSEESRAELLPRRASCACPPTKVASHWTGHCRFPCAPSLLQRKANIHNSNKLTILFHRQIKRFNFSLPCMLGYIAMYSTAQRSVLVVVSVPAIMSSPTE